MPKKKAEVKEELRTSVIYCGDNLDVMERLPSESIDLIYIDPPFFSNRHYEVIWGNGAELRAFGDRWKGGVNVYVGWMRERLIETHRRSQRACLFADVINLSKEIILIRS